MKINISRQNIYLLILSVFLLIFVLIFSFGLLIPEGKDYRNKRSQLKKEEIELRKYKDFQDNVQAKLTEIKAEKRHIITAFDAEFDTSRFQKQHEGHFNTLTISEKTKGETIEEFVTYEVNTTSQINSPKSFYDFLDAVNKSDWIVSVNFPIEFKRENEIIRSSFTMKVYNTKLHKKRDSNSTK